MPIKIKIELARINAKPPLMALADVTVQADDVEIKIRRCAVFERAGQPPWASFPRRPIEKNGTRIYVNLIEASKDLKKQIFDKILEEFDAATSV